MARVVAGSAEDAARWGEVTTLPLTDFSATATFIEHPVIYVEDLAQLTVRTPRS